MSHYTAQITRLYDTVFDRAPDAEGLAFWEKATDAGYPMLGIVNLFITAPEFAQTYGAPGTHDFVREMYGNVLDRAPDAGGLQHWTAVIDAGAVTRADVVWYFSESREHTERMEAAAPAPEPVVVAPAPQPEPAPVAVVAPPEPVAPAPAVPFAFSGTFRGDIFTGGEAGDTALGFEGNDTLIGGGGNDTLLGLANDDRLEGGPGDDILSGGTGSDVLVGGPGSDIFQFYRTDEDDTIADFERGDAVQFMGDGFAPVSIYTGPEGALVLNLTFRQGTAMATFANLTAADEGWVRDAIIFG